MKYTNKKFQQGTTEYALYHARLCIDDHDITRLGYYDIKLIMEFLDRCTFALKQYANQDNWEYEKDYGPYGEYWNYYWIGGHNPWDIASDILEEDS